MRRFSYKKYLLLGGFLFLTVSLPPLFVESLRGKCIAFFSPFLRGVDAIRLKKHEEIERLEAENHLLRIEIGKLRSLLEQQSIAASKYEETSYLFGLKENILPARVIYRDPGNWTSCFWVNVGEETNRILGRCIVGKNSPVLFGKAVVGVVDYVGRKQSRVRLITDVGLKPSVRAVRGFPQNIALLEHLEPLLRYLTHTSQSDPHLIQELENLKARLSNDQDSWYLAKGILQGAKALSWRKVLRGIGFNYDFADEKGPARELISGKPLSNQSYPVLPILKEGDLLVTTGMDGVFPIGLRVAEVTKIFPLREGAYTYEIEAVPVAANLDSLHTVFIIPPIGYEDES